LDVGPIEIVLHALSLSELNGPPFDEFFSTTQALRELYIMSDMAGAVAVIDPNRRMAMYISPSFKKADGGVSAVFLNSNNTELTPALVTVSLLSVFPFIASRHDVPSFAVKGEETTAVQSQEVELEDSHIYIAVLQGCCPVGYHKKWIEGGIFEQDFNETFGADFGAQRAQ
jgi:hypothetical protein